MKKLNNEQLASLKKYIDEELRRRCFFVETTLKQELNRDNVKLRFSSNKFNTIPVIHSEIELCDFGGSVTLKKNDYVSTKGKDDKTKEIITVEQFCVWLNIDARYEGNCVNILKVVGIFNLDSNKFFATEYD